MNQYSRLYTFFFFVLCFTCVSKQAQAQCDPRRDSLALVALFDSTGGNNWTIKTNWKVAGQPIGTWYGITTDAGGCVTCIDLDGLVDCRFDGVANTGNNLVGVLPQSLDSLKNLNGLYLTANKLFNNIPNLNLPSLQNLVVARNQLSGTIPNFNLPNLKVLTLTSNQLSGNIPNFNLPNLQHLYIPNNQLNGNIPNFNLPNLLQLQLYNNQLIGNIPNFNLPNLQSLYLSVNKLSGNIPNLNLPNLFYLQLDNNQLSGNVPNFNLQKLEQLSLYFNQLNGTIPNFNLPNLKYLQLGFNQLNGIIPDFNLPNLESLELYNNQLIGAIPNFRLPNLTNLALNNNQLTGAIPNFNLPKLLLLTFYQNKIDTCPKFTNLVSIKKDTTFQRGLRNFGNRLTFDDILPNMNFNTTATFIYAPQDSIFKDTTYNRTTNDPLSINLNIDDTVTTNIYKWFKNGTLYRTVNGSNKLSFASLALADAGVYTCQVTNPNAPLLTLYSRKATVRVVSLCRERDSLALIDLYNSTNGANWTNKWDLTKPINTWFGVSLDVNGCVTQVIMINNNLIGILPNLDMPNLVAFNLGNNQLNGVIPNFNLPNLQTVSLANNQLSGTIPNFNLPNLQYLSLDYNQLSGTIPNFNLPNLQYLSLNGNPLSGIIPNFNLPNLRILSLNNNQLSGIIPYLNLPNLQDLSLDGNQLSGIIPDFNLPNLRYLNLRGKQLSGSIPNFNLPKLEILYLNNNQLSGTIPNFNLPNLKQIYIDNNKLSGIIPNFNLPKLEILRLYQNQLDSCPKFTNLPALKKDINNQFYGLRNYENKLTFDDILPNMNFNTTATFVYSPQDSIMKDTTYQNTEGGNLTIDLGIDAAITSNVYKWYKNNVFIDSIVGNNKRIFNNIRLADAGVWTCRVTNPNAPLLTLYSRKATLRVMQTPPPTLTLFKDSLVLVFPSDVLATSVNSNTLKIHGLETGFRTGTFTVQGTKVVFRPTIPFNTGEEIMVTVKSVLMASGSAFSNSVIKKHIPVTVRSNPNFISQQYTGLQTAATHDGGYVYAADFNRDGRVDLIQASGYYGLNIPYTIQFQNTDGSFTTSQTITSNVYSGLGSLADLNNDGYSDITISTNAPSEFKVYLNDKTGHFSTGTSYTLPSFNDALTYGDVDGDGDIDLVSSAGLAGGTNYIGVAKNNGNGTFQPVVQYSIDPTFGFTVHLNDMDNDGDLDIVLQGGNNYGKSPFIILFENDGLGNYTRTNQYGQIITNAGIIRDFNNDGKLDLLAANDSLRLFFGNGNMTLQTPSINIDRTVTSLNSWAAGDFNGDNSMDFMVLVNTGGVSYKPLRLYNNNGAGNFSLQQLCLTVDGGASVSDINNDGKLDIAYWSLGSKKTFVVYQVPTIDSVKQDSICMGKTYRLPTGRIVSVAGTYLDTFRSNIGCDSIRFTTKLSIKSPTDAIDDNITVNETNTTEFTVIDNDRFDATAQLNITLLKKPQYGTLTTLGNGKFRYESLPILRGVTQMFSYLLCNTLCPNECDSAQVTIDIQGLSPVMKNSKGITPQNHDGKNDVLEFDETEDLTRYPESELIIYNRWNDIVFRAKPYLNNWDGSWNGQPLPAGTYYYILHLNQKEGKTLTGDVTIIR